MIQGKPVHGVFIFRVIAAIKDIDKTVFKTGGKYGRIPEVGADIGPVTETYDAEIAVIQTLTANFKVDRSAKEMLEFDIGQIDIRVFLKTVLGPAAARKIIAVGILTPELDVDVIGGMIIDAGSDSVIPEIFAAVPVRGPGQIIHVGIADPSIHAETEFVRLFCLFRLPCRANTAFQKNMAAAMDVVQKIAAGTSRQAIFL